MCTLLFAHQAHPDYPLVIAANRDEYYARPTQVAGFWPGDLPDGRFDASDVLAGRDLQAGGTWLGITRTGRWATITNVIEPVGQRPRADARTRGELVSDFLTAGSEPGTYAREVAARARDYNGFNLVVGEGDSVWFVSNRTGAGYREPGQPLRLAAGIHGVSNHPLGTEWPRVSHGCALLARALAAPVIDTQLLLDGLASGERFDQRIARDLLDTAERERMAAPLFVSGAVYGTCSSTVVTVRRDGRVELIERTTNPTLAELPAVRYGFVLTARPAESSQ